jgi:hypothetical protein
VLCLWPRWLEGTCQDGNLHTEQIPQTNIL